MRFGPPFVGLRKNFVDAPIQTIVRRAESAADDPRVFSGAAGSWLLDGSPPYVYFTMYNVDYPVLVGYIFESAANRWGLDWQENGCMQEKPWDGRRSQSYAVFLAEIPLGFKGVADLRVEHDRIVLVERETGTIRSPPAAGLQPVVGGR